MSDSCKAIPMLKSNEKEAVYGLSSDCLSDSVAHELYGQMSPKVAKVVNSDESTGTAFFVKDGTEVVTNSHVVEGFGISSAIVDSRGQLYDTILEHLDVKNDLALSKVLNIKADPDRAVTFGNSAQLQKGDAMVIFGHPDGSARMFASPGVYSGSRGPWLNFHAEGSKDAVSRLLDIASSTAKGMTIQDEVRGLLNAEKINFDGCAHKGQSGSPVTGVDGKVLGVMSIGVSDGGARLIPSDKVIDLLASTESNFHFDYRMQRVKLAGYHAIRPVLVNVTRADGVKPPFIFPLLQTPRSAGAANLSKCLALKEDLSAAK